MFRFSAPITCIAVAFLLSLQASGVHLHVGIGDHVDHHGIQVEQTLSAQHAEVDHQHHADIEIEDTPLGLKKFDPEALLTLSWTAPMGSPVHQRFRVFQPQGPPRKPTRYRPPLRAPPVPR